jgi:hypothetical protein
MSKYYCEICSFKTRNKTDHSRHIKTKKHLEKVKEGLNDTQMAPKVYPNNTLKKHRRKMIIYKCLHCDNIFSNASSLGRHKKTCTESKSKDIEVEKVKKEYKKFQKEAKEKEKILKKQLETYEHMLKSMTSPQTINYYNYIVQNYPNAPALECQKSYNNMIEAKTMTLMEVVSMYHYDNKLVKFIGNYIIKIYKHKKPKDQSFWSTDISRLTYIISESCKNGLNTNGWAYDKKGSKIKKIIIEPALEYIRDQLFIYCQESGGKTEGHILKHMIAANSVIQFIDSGELSDKINKYIAPEFAVKQMKAIK